jgi:hypothetical protein
MKKKKKKKDKKKTLDPFNFIIDWIYGREKTHE